MSEDPLGNDRPVALITGSARGIGAACARRLAADGFHVVIADKISGDKVVAEIEQHHHRASFEYCDLSTTGATAELAKKVLAQHGRCDVLVNNAAHLGRGAFNDIDESSWRQEFAVNVDAAFILCRATLPSMRERGFGRIVNMISNTVWQPPPVGLAAYVSTKAALLGLTRALAVEVGAWGVTVNAIAPGLTRTEKASENMTNDHFDAVCESQALKRTLVPEDVAGALSFLVSSDAAAITGQALRVDGGLVTL